jgi:hypothetical protein
VAGYDVSRVTVMAAQRAIESGLNGFVLMTRPQARPEVIVDIIPAAHRSGRALYWLVFRDGSMRMLDGTAIIHHVARVSSAA